MRMYFIFLENKSPGLHFAVDNIGLSSLKFFWWAPKFLLTLARGRFRRSRASKVTDIGVNRKRWADFLLVPSNFGPILHRFWDMTGFMCYLPHPHSTLILGVFPLYQIAHVGVSQSRGLKLFGREVIFEEFQPIWSRYLIVTDRQTDGQTDGRFTVASPRSALASRGKNSRTSTVTIKYQIPKITESHMCSDLQLVD